MTKDKDFPERPSARAITTALHSQNSPTFSWRPSASTPRAPRTRPSHPEHAFEIDVRQVRLLALHLDPGRCVQPLELLVRNRLRPHRDGHSRDPGRSRGTLGSPARLASGSDPPPAIRRLPRRDDSFFPFSSRAPGSPPVPPAAAFDAESPLALALGPGGLRSGVFLSVGISSTVGFAALALLSFISYGSTKAFFPAWWSHPMKWHAKCAGSSPALTLVTGASGSLPSVSAMVLTYFCASSYASRFSFSFAWLPIHTNTSETTSRSMSRRPPDRPGKS